MANIHHETFAHVQVSNIIINSICAIYCKAIELCKTINFDLIRLNAVPLDGRHHSMPIYHYF